MKTVLSVLLVTGQAKQVVEVDLRLGIVKGYSSYVQFLVPPVTSHSRRCDVQAVLRLNFSGPYKVSRTMPACCLQ